MSIDLTFGDDDEREIHWANAFVVAGEVSFEGQDSDAVPDIRPAIPTANVDLSPFTRADVAELYGLIDGEPDVIDWLCYGRLKDGRYFSLTAGCDASGWTCRAGGIAFIAETKLQIEIYGLDPDERERLGVTY